MGISDDIKPKKSPRKTEGGNKDQIKDPNEVLIRHEEPDINYPFSRDSELEKREEDFFEPDSSEENLREKTETEQDVKDNPKKKQGNPMTKWVVILIIILIALLVWQNYSKIIQITGLKKLLNPSQESNLESYNSDLQGTDYTSQAGSSSSTANSSANQNQTSATVTPEASIDKSKITIDVLNGNGISGSAGTVKDQLTGAGFTVDKVANAYNFNYENTIIYFKTGKNAEAELIKTTLSNRQCETSNDDSVVGNYDIVIVVGKS
jgi:hypothetical protein